MLFNQVTNFLKWFQVSVVISNRTTPYNLGDDSNGFSRK